MIFAAFETELAIMATFSLRHKLLSELLKWDNVRLLQPLVQQKFTFVDLEFTLLLSNLLSFYLSFSFSVSFSLSFSRSFSLSFAHTNTLSFSFQLASSFFLVRLSDSHERDDHSDILSRGKTKFAKA